MNTDPYFPLFPPQPVLHRVVAMGEDVAERNDLRVIPDGIDLFRSNLEGAVQRLPDDFKGTLHSKAGLIAGRILFKSQSCDELLDLKPSPQCLLKILSKLRLHKREHFPRGCSV